MRLALLLVLTATPSFAAPPKPPPDKRPFTVVEATIADLRKALEERRVTSRELVVQYLRAHRPLRGQAERGHHREPRRASRKPRSATASERQGKVRGPLHGIPIALKDNIHTTNMPTTGGALAFDGFVPPYEATLTKNLREAGAIIIAKTDA